MHESRERMRADESGERFETAFSEIGRYVHGGKYNAAGLPEDGVKIAKPLLLVLTPIGVAAGLYEGYRLAGGLVVLMAALLGLISVAILSIVLTIRREKKDGS